MENIFDSINPVDFFATTNGIISSLSGLITMLLGIILAFIIIKTIVSIFRKPNGETENTEQYYENGEYKYRKYNPETADDFPY